VVSLRVLLVLETDWIARGPAQHHHLLERLQERGHDVRVIDFNILWSKNRDRWPWHRTKRLRAKGKVIERVSIHVIRPAMIRAPLLCYASFIPPYTVELIRQIKSYRPDVILGEGLLNVFLATRIAKIFKIPFIKYLLDSDHNLIPERYLRPLGFWLEIQGIKKSDQILVINKQLATYARRMGASTIPKVVTAGVDRKRFNPTINGRLLRNQLGFAEDETVLFFMGWLYDFSGLRELAKSMADLTDTKIRLLILGHGDLYEELRQISKKTKTENIITILDWVQYSELPKYVAAADICLLPALLNNIMRDIVPIKLYEYLACGKPVISTRLPGVMREFAGNSGLIYVRNPEDVITGAQRISRNSQEYMRLSKEAMDSVADLDWESVASRFEEILKNTV